MDLVACDPRTMAAMARRGEIESLDALTRCQGERLLSVGRRWCRTEEDARDAVQDALLSAQTHLPDFRGEGSLEGWVVQMVARACNRMRRGRKNDPHLHAVDMELPDNDASPEALTARSHIAAALGTALLEVDPVDRAILLLAEVEGLTGPEISMETGLSAVVVRARLSRTRKRVRTLLEGRLTATG